MRRFEARDGVGLHALALDEHNNTTCRDGSEVSALTVRSQ